jgi:membrane fusion protein (multidrug efflux system)
MFARGRLEQAEDQNALTVPIIGVQHQPDDSATVLLVNEQEKVELRTVQLGSIQGTSWIVQSGLKAGDRVIVEGTQKVAPGMLVKAVPYPAEAAPAPKP